MTASLDIRVIRSSLADWRSMKKECRHARHSTQIKLFPNIHNKIVYFFFHHFCWTAVKSGRELATSTLAPTFLTYLTYPTYPTYLTYLTSLQKKLKHRALIFYLMTLSWIFFAEELLPAISFLWPYSSLKRNILLRKQLRYKFKFLVVHYKKLRKAVGLRTGTK